MNLESDKRLNIQLRLDFSSAPTGEARQAGREDIESLSVVNEPERPANTSRIMEEVCERANLKEALRQVRGNKGSAGVDRMTVDQLGDYLKQHWPAIREQLLNGTYEPKPVRRVEIPKPDGGGMRKLASQPCWTASSSKRQCRCCRGDGTRRFPDTATGFDRVDQHIRPWLKRSSTSRKATDG
jgi:RNA-directed DNA polymerase